MRPQTPILAGLLLIALSTIAMAQCPGGTCPLPSTDDNLTVIATLEICPPGTEPAPAVTTNEQEPGRGGARQLPAETAAVLTSTPQIQHRTATSCRTPRQPARRLLRRLFRR